MEKVAEILRSNNFAFKKQFGQNFITDENLLLSIAENANTKGNYCIEIGTGAGTLTRAISKFATKVYSFEIDKSLKDVLAQTLSGYNNVEVIFSDFMKKDMEEIENNIVKNPYVVCANLPYNITSPVIMRFVEEAKNCKSLCIMVQEEVALRLCANENTKDYGAITAAISAKGTATIIKKVPRTMFYPQPNVDSAVVFIDFSKPKIDVSNMVAYKKVVRCAFSSRRKTFINNLTRELKLEKDVCLEMLKSFNLREDIRGEALSPKLYNDIANYLVERGLI